MQIHKPVHNAIRKREARDGFLLALPALIVFVAVIAYPFINSFLMSFTNRTLLFQTSQFVGMDNYVDIFSDPGFTLVIYNTIVFLVVATVLPFVLGLLWAIILNSGFFGAEFLRGLTLINWIIPSTSVAFLWMWFFHGEYGVVNTILQTIGITNTNINWLGRLDTAMAVVIIARTWQLLPWTMAFLTGGLNGVSTEVIEASRIDGAGNIRTFLHVVLPEMKGINTIVILMSAISNLLHFDLFWVMTQGGPARSTLTLALETYRTAFKNFNMGMAAAVGVVWTITLTIVSIFYIRAMSKQEKGEDYV